MSSLQIRYDKRFAGAKATALNGAQLTTYPSGAATVWDVAAGNHLVCTGYYLEVSSTDNYAWLQTTDGLYLIIDLNEQPLSWQLTEGYKSIGTIKPKKAQSVVNTIVSNNRRIVENNLICARFASKLTSAQKETLYGLQTRLEQRNNALINDGFCTVQTVGAPKGYSDLEKYLTQFMETNTIGSVTAVVVTAVVVAALSTAAYYAYQYYMRESEQDVRYSDELTKILTSKLTDEEYAQLEAETRGMITKAVIKAKFSSSLKYLLIGGACLLAGYLILNNQQR